MYGNVNQNMDEIFFFQKISVIFKKWVHGEISQSNQHILILDGHGSHVMLEAIAQVDEFNLDMVTLPSIMTFALGLRPRQGWKCASWECNLGVTFTLLGVRESVKEWVRTLPSGFSLWELESRWTFEFLENNLKGQNSLNWKTPCNIGKILRHRCLKWACMIHLNTYNTSYGWKKGRESKYQFDSWPLKIRNRPDSLVCRWHATYRWKFFNEDYNFTSDLTSIKGLHKKLRASKVAKVLISRISRFLIWESWEKWHLGAAPVVSHT